MGWTVERICAGHSGAAASADIPRAWQHSQVKPNLCLGVCHVVHAHMGRGAGMGEVAGLVAVKELAGREARRDLHRILAREARLAVAAAARRAVVTVGEVGDAGTKPLGREESERVRPYVLADLLHGLAR